jgi:hypothetical protein
MTLVFQGHTTVLTDTPQYLSNAINSNPLYSQRKFNTVNSEDWKNMRKTGRIRLQKILITGR